ncbi:hypothetical protein DM02DRAFT_663756 [Periconia macrospinosa]|uniref:Diels-Alderase C-terminal domain-containing protein n=1 Tax=Periconia macrospinosa TaxID=97972 RepID=A0A2V1D0U8_9PLEO|nr:hypothetical protein DM02DRAFT_663756 [Periconia macrospinosa]
MRAVIGRYAFSLWKPVSRIHRGTEYTSGVLYKDGQPIVTVYGPDYDILETDGQLSIQAHFNGTVSGGLNDTSSGWVITFSEPKNRKHWRFVSEHGLLAHEVRLGPNSGLSVFTDRVKGGELHSDQYSGYGICEQITLPRYISPLSAWEVIKTHRVNTGSTAGAVIWNMLCAASREIMFTLSLMVFGRDSE